MDYLTAKKKLLTGNPDAEWFKKNKYFLEYGYSLLILNNHQEAFRIFEKFSKNDIRADWGKKIIPILINKYPEEEPTFLQVRNFLELDIDLLLQTNNKDYVLNLINNTEYFYSISRESYKFTGRALYYNGYYDLALKFLLLSKDKFYNDPELHFLLAKLYLYKKDKEKCKHAITTCLKFIPEYIPAQKILQEAENI